MDHFYQQKLVNEKNELQKQVAKANKQIAQLSEQVKQYEAILASFDESYVSGKKPASEKDVIKLKSQMHNEKYPIPSNTMPKPQQRPSKSEPVKNKPTVNEGLKSPNKLINELNVMGALKTGGIGGALKAFAANVKNRGLLGATISKNAALNRASNRAAAVVQRGENQASKANETLSKINVTPGVKKAFNQGLVNPRTGAYGRSVGQASQMAQNIENEKAQDESKKTNRYVYPRKVDSSGITDTELQSADSIQMARNSWNRGIRKQSIGSNAQYKIDQLRDRK